MNNVKVIIGFAIGIVCGIIGHIIYVDKTEMGMFSDWLYKRDCEV